MILHDKHVKRRMHTRRDIVACTLLAPFSLFISLYLNRERDRAESMIRNLDISEVSLIWNRRQGAMRAIGSVKNRASRESSENYLLWSSSGKPVFNASRSEIALAAASSTTSGFSQSEESAPASAALSLSLSLSFSLSLSPFLSLRMHSGHSVCTRNLRLRTIKGRVFAFARGRDYSPRGCARGRGT